MNNFSTNLDKNRKKRPQAAQQDAQQAVTEGKDDLLTLNDFSEQNVLENIKQRFKANNQIFTQIGAPILISLNPYRHLPIFNIGMAQKVRNYSAKVRGKSSSAAESPGPHLFMIAEDSF